MENIKSNTIVHVIKNIFIRMDLKNCRGQIYDGTWDMTGKISGDLKPLPYTVKCISSAYQWNWWLKNVTFWMMSWALKFSPKREHLLRKINDNIKKEDSKTFKKLKNLSAARWTVRAECMKRVIDNYESLLPLWEECFEEKLDQEKKARILGCQSQMVSFFLLHQSIIQALSNDG